MRRSDSKYDLVIIGGGIYGAFAVRDAALQGLRVCLVESKDFGAATSANSLKIIHGGLRYLQNLDITRMRESIRERRTMHRLAPHLVRPLPFVIPCYGHGLRGPEIMAGALLTNEIISSDRNKGVLRERKIGRAKTISSQTLKKLIPDLPEQNISGGAIWFDGQATNTERLLAAVLEDARHHGADLLNYTEALEVNSDKGVVCGVRLRDCLSGEESVVSTSAIVNSSGPWVDKMLEKSGCELAKPLFYASKGMNLVTRKLVADKALAIPYAAGYKDAQAIFDKSKLHFFIVPWKEYSLIGTRHIAWQGEPDQFQITREDVQMFISEINDAFPRANLEHKDVLRVYGGMLPALKGHDGEDVQIEKQYTLVDHAAQGGPSGLFSIVGVKWTTARHVAGKAIESVTNWLGCSYDAQLSEMPLQAAAYADLNTLKQALVERSAGKLGSEMVAMLIERHGSSAIKIVAIAAEVESMREVIKSPTGRDTLVAEVHYSIVQENAKRLSDVLQRRTELCLGGYPGVEVVEKVAKILKEVLDVSNEELEIQKNELIISLQRYWL